ncbi:hypothetical protein [Janthinobacterium sp. LB2P70]|uniref:hypothetical protein n=1 Tax=Janthinobacterium sp. LB2P70 TaxID=3424197 RepID=UPI003F229F21
MQGAQAPCSLPPGNKKPPEGGFFISWRKGDQRSKLFVQWEITVRALGIGTLRKRKCILPGPPDQKINKNAPMATLYVIFSIVHLYNENLKEENYSPR